MKKTAFIFLFVTSAAWSVDFGRNTAKVIRFQSALRASGEIPTCSTSDSCRMQCYAGDGGAWSCVRGDGGTITVTAGTSPTSETGPFTTSAGGTARYYVSDVTDAKANYLAAAVATDAGIRYDADFTVICADNPTNDDGNLPMTWGHGSAAPGSNQFYMRSVGAAETRCVFGGAIQSSIDLTDGNLGEGWGVKSCRLSGSTGYTRHNGAQTSGAVTVPADDPNAVLYFGRYTAGGFAIRGGLAWCQYWTRSLTDAEVLRIENAWFGSVAGAQNLTSTRSSAAWLHAADNYVYSYADEAPRVHVTYGILSDVARTNYWTNSLDTSAQTAVGTPQLCAPGPALSCNGSSGPFSKYNRGAESDEFEDDDAAALEGIESATAGTTTGSYTVSCYLASGTSTDYTLSIVTDGTGGGSCTGTDLSSTFARKTCTPTAIGGAPTYIKARLLVGDAVGDTGTIKVSQCQLEKASGVGAPVVCGAGSCTANADLHTVSTTGWPTISGEVELKFTPIAGGNPGTAEILLDTFNNASAAAGISLGIDTSGRVVLITRNSNASTSTTSSAQSWTALTTYAIRAKWGSGNAYVYLDGALIGSTTDGTAKQPATNHTTASIGSDATGAQNAGGYIAELRLSR